MTEFCLHCIGNCLKVLSLSQGVEGKVIHLVKGIPPSLNPASAEDAEGQGSRQQQGAEPGVENVTVQTQQDMLFVGNIPISSHTDITQVTQVRKRP